MAAAAAVVVVTTKGKPWWCIVQRKLADQWKQRGRGDGEGNPRGCVPRHPDRRFTPYRFARCVMIVNREYLVKSRGYCLTTAAACG